MFRKDVVAVNIKRKRRAMPMKILVSTVKPLISHGVKIVLMMVFVVSFIWPAYTYTQEELWEHLGTKANILYKRGQYTEAANVAKEALKVAKEIYGSGHSNVASSMYNLAILYRKQGKYSEAESLFKRALEIYEKAFDKDNPQVANSIYNLAILYRDQGKYAAAEPLFKRALEIYEKALGKDHPDVAQSLKKSGDTLSKPGQIC